MDFDDGPKLAQENCEEQATAGPEAETAAHDNVCPGRASRVEERGMRDFRPNVCRVRMLENCCGASVFVVRKDYAFASCNQVVTSSD